MRATASVRPSVRPTFSRSDGSLSVSRTRMLNNRRRRQGPDRPHDVSAAPMRRRSQTSRSRRRLIAAAYHEAGHAVAAYHVGVRFRRLAIGKNTAKDLGWLGLGLTP